MKLFERSCTHLFIGNGNVIHTSLDDIKYLKHTKMKFYIPNKSENELCPD